MACGGSFLSCEENDLEPKSGQVCRYGLHPVGNM